MEEPTPEEMAGPPPGEKEAPPARPDWLVGADEGVAAETERQARKAGPAEPVRLIRPQSDGEAPAAPPPPRQSASADYGALDLTSDPAPETPVAREALSISSLNARRAAETEKPAAKKAWTAAASSVPKLSLVQGTKPEPGLPSPPPPAEPDAEDAGFPDDAMPVAAVAAPSAVVPRGRPAPMPALREAWWAIALDALRSDRRIQLLILLVVVGGFGVAFLRPVDDSRVSLGKIRGQPDRYDGRIVTVGGRVGEVFPVGGGYAFYLHEGRDTLVVFTRSRTPVPRQNVTLKGSISTGFLDGLPRQALFEQF